MRARISNGERHLVLLIALTLAFGLGVRPAWSAVSDLWFTGGAPTGGLKAAGQGQKSKPSKPRANRRRSSGNSGRGALEAASRLPWPENVKSLAGSGAVLVVDPHAGEEPVELFSLNPDRPYVPASILKVVLAAAALELLGPRYRFTTDFYLTRNGDLWVVGRGDPFLVSEEMCLVAAELAARGLKKVGDIRLDTSFFEPGLILDGTTFTKNPYDAFNLSLSVNFNTVNYLIDRGGEIVECGPCTPLTPTTLRLAELNRPKSAPKKRREYRINISESPAAAEVHFGEFLKALLERGGVEVTGEVVTGGRLPAGARPFYSHSGTMNLEELTRTLMEYSNNFMTNQIFLTMGAERFGAPATMEKGVRVIHDWLDSKGLSRLEMVEGSGLSRLNSLTARQMAEVLQVFEPSRHLAKSRDDGSVFYKTGTMSDISTLAGYLVRPERPDEPLSFVILLNGAYQPGTREKILDALKAHFIDNPEAKKG
jgi:D-alanyl-D-alanine carboxypeptidase/D-alanyl-D-alanine-endopeptidase (penicillin-binding protein 4)